MPKLVFLWTDIALGLVLLGVLAYIFHVRRTPGLLATWAQVFRRPAPMASALVLLVFVLVALLDSVHYRPRLADVTGASGPAYATRTVSLLDALLERPATATERTYSAPFAWASFAREPNVVDGVTTRVFPRLVHGGAHLTDPERQRTLDVVWRGFAGGLAGLMIGLVLAMLLARPDSRLPWRTAWLTLALIGLLVGALAALMPWYHVAGTDRTGNDVMVQAIKSIRTAIVMGALTTLATLPFAIVLGIMAGYFKGWVDDVIQYIYTTLASIPNVLLIAACVLMIQVFIDKHPEMFETGLERADVRLLLLCIVLGVTGWAGLCRLLRGETLKLRELEYVQAAHAFGVGHARIMARHILPNVMHIVLITLVLDFSAIVLYEAVLSYVGVGVDPATNSFGSMINLSRSEMARDPLVWWNLATAFVFMLTLVLAVNLFADGVRDAFDPRTRPDTAPEVAAPVAQSLPPAEAPPVSRGAAA